MIKRLGAWRQAKQQAEHMAKVQSYARRVVRSISLRCDHWFEKTDRVGVTDPYGRDIYQCVHCRMYVALRIDQ